MISQRWNFLFLGLFVLCVDTASTRATDYSNTIEATTSYITNRMALEHVPGLAVALVESQQVVWATGFGYADLEHAIPVTSQTVYRIGSVSKIFPTVALLQLAEQGILTMDTPVTNLLPEFAIQYRDFGIPATNELVVRHLVNYHSGLPGDVLNSGFSTTMPFDGHQDWLMGYLPTAYPHYPPDLVYNYCNVGFTLAERVVRFHNTNGFNYAEYCREKIFDPLRMSSSSLLKDRAAISNNLAKAYMYMGGGYFPLPEQYINMRGAGGIYSSVEDMTKFLMMFLADGMSPSGRLLESASFTEMLERQGEGLPLNVGNIFVAGLGWDSVSNARLSHASSRVCWKAGSVSEGHCGLIEVLPEAQLAAVILADADMILAWDACDHLLRHALEDKLGLPVPDPVSPIASPLITNMPPSELESLAGVYVGTEGFDLILTNGHCLTWVPGAEDPSAVATNIWPRENGWFSFRESQNIELCFTNLAGRDVIVARQLWPDASFIAQSLHAERYEPPPLSAAWSNRLDTAWPVVDAFAPESYQYLLAEYQGAPAGLKLSVAHGVLIIEDFENQIHVLEPHDDNVAFVAGITPRCGSAAEFMQTNGMEVLQFAGYRYQAPSDVPAIGANQVVTNSLDVAGLSALYAFMPPVTGLLYEASLVNAPSNFVIRVLDGNTIHQGKVWAGEGLDFESAEPAPYYLQVQASLTDARTGAFELVLSYPLLIRDFRDDPPGCIIQWQGQTNAAYSLLSTTNIMSDFSVFRSNITGGFLLSSTTTVSGIKQFFAVERE